MATEKRLIDPTEYKAFLERYIKELYEVDAPMIAGAVERCLQKLEAQPTTDAVVLPCKIGDTVYGNYYGKTQECKVIKSKVCQFKDGSLHYFLDVEFYIIDPYYCDGRLMRCHHQAVFGESFGGWDRAYLTREEAEAALAKMDGGNKDELRTM